jgi:tetratricopeptide (TPR) repeat protein
LLVRSLPVASLLLLAACTSAGSRAPGHASPSSASPTVVPDAVPGDPGAFAPSTTAATAAAVPTGAVPSVAVPKTAAAAGAGTSAASPGAASPVGSATPIVGAAIGSKAMSDVLSAVREQLDLALVQRGTPELANDLADTLDALPDAIATATAANEAVHGSAGPEIEAAKATLAAITAPTDEAFAALRRVEGRLPQTSELLIARLFEEGRPAEAAGALVIALGRWPNEAPLHALARTWRDAIPDVTPVLAALDTPPAMIAAASDTVTASPSLAVATRGYLLLSHGIAQQKAGDNAGSAATFEAGAAELERAAHDALADKWELASRRGDCLINAGWAHYALAQATLASGALKDAVPDLQAAEQDFSAALLAQPDDADAVNGTNLTGDMYLQGGSPEGIRDFFSRMARKHDRALWWNNYAFFCRETKQY